LENYSIEEKKQVIAITVIIRGLRRREIYEELKQIDGE
jgi:hypothetical protein